MSILSDRDIGYMLEPGEQDFWCRFGCMTGMLCPHCNCSVCLQVAGVDRPIRKETNVNTQ